MTFALVHVAEDRELIVGTIWAAGETDAQQVATSLNRSAPGSEAERLMVRRSEEREIPLRHSN
jgi:hypothetical protein